MAETAKVPLVTGLPVEVGEVLEREAERASEFAVGVMSEAGRVKVMVGLLALAAPNSSQVSVTVTEVPAAAVPSSAGDVLLVTGMPLMVAYGGVVGVSSRVGAGGAEVGAGCERLLALSMNESVTGMLTAPASSVA